MSDVIVYKLIDFALSAVAAGIERQAVLDRVQALQAEGKTPDELADAIKAMRDEALKAL